MGFGTLPPVEIVLPEHEREIVNVAFRRQSVPFALGITDRAVYVPVINRWSLRKPWSLRRVPLEQVQSVVVRRTKRGPVLLLSALLVVLGAAALMAMLLPFREGSKGPVSIYPFVTIVAGFVLPFTTRGRRTLHVHFAEGEAYEWKPPMFAAAMTRAHLDYLLSQVIKGFRRLRIYVSEE